jgi:carbohydrate kinase (thermoresistant glucokinase family)
MIFVMMGVCGCGKTEIGERVAARIGGTYVEGDSFHPPANVAKMRGGTPLNDDDRWPWLKILAGEIDKARQAGRHMALGCSALKKVYRDVLRDGHDDVVFVHLKGSRELIQSRLDARVHEYMPRTLLGTQLATLEEPDPKIERAIAVDIAPTPEVIAANVVATLKEKGYL